MTRTQTALVAFFSRDFGVSAFVFDWIEHYLALIKRTHPSLPVMRLFRCSANNNHRGCHLLMELLVETRAMRSER